MKTKRVTIGGLRPKRNNKYCAVPIYSQEIAQFFINSSGDEVMYDRVLEKNMDFLKDRAVNTMGFIDEELSIIPPIMTHGYVKRSQSVITANELDAEHKDIFQKFVSFITSIPSKIISFFVNFFTSKDVMSHSIFFKGRDDKVRCSLISITMISFTEQQIVAYVCDYDIALGIILKESVQEVFYRDVESVTYGGENWHVYTKRQILISTFIVGKNYCSFWRKYFSLQVRRK